MADADTDYMAMALELARRGLGTTAPNPSVGAVIVADGNVIARGGTQPGGRPHAETEALGQAGARSRGATLYVTLEPCSHHGKTPPCVDGIIAAGIARVVVSIVDPDPRVAGRGLARLRAAGIEVAAGVLADEARQLTLGHILRVTRGRPFVQLKMAISADGTIVRGGQGRPVWVTGQAARADGHRLRAEADAILVGRQTVEDDDPELTCRLPGLAERSPIRIVLDTHLRIAVTSRLVRSARKPPLWLAAGRQADPAVEARLIALSCTVLRCDQLGSRIDIPGMLEALAARGITRLLVEGGPEVWRSMARAGIVDEVVCYRANGEDSNETEESAAQAGGADLARFLDRQDFALAGTRDLGSDRAFIFRPA